MIFTVVNHHICVEKIDIIGVSSSAILHVGDAECVTLTSFFDTPPESLIIGPKVPLASKGPV